jgi:hypothetical protein
MQIHTVLIQSGQYVLTQRELYLKCGALMNSIGLSLDIKGFILLFYIGIPNDIKSEGSTGLDLENNNQHIKKSKIKLRQYLKSFLRYGDPWISDTISI